MNTQNPDTDTSADQIRHFARALCTDELFVNHAWTLLDLYRDRRDMELTLGTKKLAKEKFRKVIQASKRLKSALKDDVFGDEHQRLLELIYKDHLDFLSSVKGRATEQKSIKWLAAGCHDWFKQYGVDMDKLNVFIENSLAVIYPKKGDRPSIRTIQTAVSAVRS